MKAHRKIAIVTGGASGVGAAAARLLAGSGHDVLINYKRSADLARVLVADCEAAGADAIAVQGDVADDAVCRELVDAAKARWGRLDSLVNSAGATRFVPMPDLEGVNAADFQTIFGVNAIGPFQMARAASKLMGKSGAIVNVSSIAGQTGSGSSFPYVLSKAALNALTLGLARTLAPNIRVNAVLPGMIEGRWMRGGLGDEAYERVKAQFSATSLLGRISTPEQIAAAVVWLLDPNCLMTGQLMVVDAGFTLGRPPPSTGA